MDRVQTLVYDALDIKQSEVKHVQLQKWIYFYIKVTLNVIGIFKTQYIYAIPIFQCHVFLSDSNEEAGSCMADCQKVFKQHLH